MCRRNDPNLNECVRNLIEKMRTKLANGIPEMMLPRMEPLSIPEIAIKQNSGAIQVDSKYTNIIVQGMSNFTLNDVAIDLNNRKFCVNLWFPSLYMTADYHLRGRLLLLPLEGHGKSVGQFSEWKFFILCEEFS